MALSAIGFASTLGLEITRLLNAFDFNVCLKSSQVCGLQRTERARTMRLLDNQPVGYAAILLFGVGAGADCVAPAPAIAAEAVN